MFLVFPKCSAHDGSKQELLDLSPFSSYPSGSPSTTTQVCAPATGPMVGAEANRSLPSSPPLAILPFLSMHFIAGVPLTRSIILFQVIHKLRSATGGKKTGRGRGGDQPLLYLPTSDVKQKEGKKIKNDLFALL